MRLRRIGSFSLVGLLASFALASAAAAVAPVNETLFGKAIDGYDPVAYFTDGKAVKGQSRFTHEWMGATWLFASAEHRDLLAADPERYAPQYGGYCAYAVSQGATADIDPSAWKIVDGKLYLNLNPEIQASGTKTSPATSPRPTPTGRSSAASSGSPTTSRA